MKSLKQLLEEWNEARLLSKVSNITLTRAQQKRNDEFFTTYEPIANEMEYHREYLKNKIVILPCDNLYQFKGQAGMQASEFWNYFHTNFANLELKELWATYKNFEGNSTLWIYKGGNDNDINECEAIELESDGDFRDEYMQKIYQQADVLITNPPFSLNIEFCKMLEKIEIDFLFLCPITLISRPFVFKNVNTDKWRISYTQVKSMFYDMRNEDNTQHTISKGGPHCLWMTNLYVDTAKAAELRKSSLKQKKLEEFKKIDDTEIINIDKIVDFKYLHEHLNNGGLIAMPITGFYDYNIKKLFDFLCITSAACEHEPKHFNSKIKVDGKEIFIRIIAKLKDNVKL